MKVSLKTALAVAPLMAGFVAPAMANPIIEYSIVATNGDHTGTLLNPLVPLPLTQDVITGTWTGSAFLKTGTGANTPFSGGSPNPSFEGIVLDTAAVSSNTPGNAFLAELFGSANNIVNSGVQATVTIIVSDNNFTAPTTAPPEPGITVANQGGGNVGGGKLSPPPGVGNNTFSFFSCINQTNVEADCSGAFDTAVDTPTVNVASSAYSFQDATDIAALSGPYAITQEYTITIGAGGSGVNGVRNTIQFNDSTNLDPVPEPGTLFILGASLVGFGFLWRRRKSV